METTFAYLKRNSFNAALLLAVLAMNGQVWLTNGRIEGLDYRIMGLDDEIQELRIDMADEFKAVRDEMAEGDRAIRADMAEEFTAIRADVSALSERMARVETRLSGVERALYADPDAPPR